ncbi:MAG: hypothetical protein MI861_25590 [Pirellulales bacterium]|nr:hypothetical protein [Pirellulales bacterium]
MKEIDLNPREGPLPISGVFAVNSDEATIAGSILSHYGKVRQPAFDPAELPIQIDRRIG